MSSTVAPVPGKPRLSIVVPYRDRAAHLAVLLPHLIEYFARAPGHQDIPYSVIVVEQVPGLPFSRGLTRNIGYFLSRGRADYVCFHDVDYLPLEADYSCPDHPTCALWYGAELRPIRPGRSKLAVRHELNNYFGGVVLLRNTQFEAANGYSTRYWGWGLQDLDLARRLEAKGFRLGRKKGRFHPLDHDHEGFTDTGELVALSQRNRALYDGRWELKQLPAEIDIEGLNTTAFELLERGPIRPELTSGRNHLERVLVRFPGPTS
ncbi:MAG TPA: galactosyltransferase-related protein [Solirubrobacteraceae bacterium]|nr:galactosyltransferase-related protein [Solirubrobacteraceae bacterium]